MAQFKPVMINKKADFSATNPAPKSGQYIVIIDAKELYLDTSDSISGRKKISNNVYVQATAPVNPTAGDVWFETAE